jgi:Uma2 family endonuclease
MTPLSTPAPARKIEYPDNDGQPMSDNTLQFRWIATIEGNLEDLFRDDLNVFVGGDLLWYPVEGDNKIRSAPDAMVVFNRPKGDRGSYKQWEEGGVAPQVVFEILSPGNRPGEMTRKFQFYQRYGVEEYYLIDPDRQEMDGWLRRDDELQPIATMPGWASPRLGIRFDLHSDEIVISRPNGERFLTFLEICQLRAETERRAEEDRLARQQAQQRADSAQQRAEAAEQRAEALAAKLRALGLDP